MTDAEIRDAALVQLKQTTRGLKGYSAPASSHWGKALDLLSQVSIWTQERDAAVAELRLTTVGYTYFTKKNTLPPASSHWGKALTYLEEIMPVTRVTVSVSGGTQNLVGTQTVTAVPTPQGQTLSVKFYIDSVLKTPTDTVAPYTYSWDTAAIADGAHEVKAVATFKGNQVQEAKRTVTTLNDPPPPDPPPPDDPPANVSVPVVTGTATQGQTLTVSNGVWTNNPTSFTRQWLRCDAGGINCNAIPGATNPNYVLVLADVGSTIRCSVIASNLVGPSPAEESDPETAVVASSAPAVPVNVNVPVITGTMQRGNVLSCTTGSWTNSPTSYAFQWRRCTSTDIGTCSNVAGATASTYTLGTAEVGKHMRCYVIATNGAGASTAATSVSTAVVTDPSPPDPPPPTAYLDENWSSGIFSNARWSDLKSYSGVGGSTNTPIAASPDGRVSIVNDPAGGSGKAARCEIRDSDPDWNGGAGLDKSEISTDSFHTFNQSGGINYGGIRWFNCPLYLPYNATEKFEWPHGNDQPYMAMYGMHRPGPTGFGAIQLGWEPWMYNANDADTFLNFMVMGGNYPEMTHQRVYNLLRLTDASGARVLANHNRWINLVWGMKFNPDTTGWFEVWVDGVNVVPRVNRPTMWAGDFQSYFKYGMYRRSGNTFPVSGKSVLYWGHTTIGYNRPF